jgi:hypothetical protein
VVRVVVMMTRTNIMMRRRMRMCGVQNIEQVMGEILRVMCLRKWRGKREIIVAKVKPSAAILSALEGLIS